MFYGIKGNRDERFREDENFLFCPMLDAKRMEVYYSLFDSTGRIVKDIAASVIDKESFSDITESVRILFFGDGSQKCRNVISHKNSLFEDDFKMSAAYMQIPAYAAFDAGNFEDVAYFEPFYFKDFIATVPKKNIAGR